MSNKVKNQLGKEFRAVMKRNIRGLSARLLLSNLNLDQSQGYFFGKARLLSLKVLTDSCHFWFVVVS